MPFMAHPVATMQLPQTSHSTHGAAFSMTERKVSGPFCHLYMRSQWPLFETASRSEAHRGRSAGLNHARLENLNGCNPM